MDYLNKFKADIDIVGKLLPSSQVTILSRDIQQNDWFPESLFWGKGVYTFYDLSGDPNKTSGDLEKYRATDKRKAVPGLNQSQNDAMYVGSATTGVKSSLKTRLSNHIFGTDNTSTGALHFNEWFYNDYKILVQLYDKSVTTRQIRLLEAWRWDLLKPMFGQQPKL